MKTELRKLLAVILVMALLGLVTSCASTGTRSKRTTPVGQKSGFLHGYYDKLTPRTAEGEPDFVWIKPGIDYTRYKKVMIDYVIFAFADDSDYKGIDADEMKKLADTASFALANAIRGRMPIVSEPGPDVLRIRTAIVDLKQSHPALSAISSVTPVGMGINILRKGTTDSWTGSGATTAEMMVLDSMTNEVLGAGEDSMSAGVTERFTKWGSVEEAFDFWGERLANRLVNFTRRR